MTLFVESFDHYNGSGTTVGFRSRWTRFASSSAASALQAGRFGGQALSVFGAGSVTGASAYADNLSTALGFSSDEFSTSFGVKFTGDEGVGYQGCQLALGFDNAAQIGVSYHADLGRLSIVRGGSVSTNGTPLWESDVGAYPPDVWHTLRLKGLIDSAAGALAIRIDQEEVATLTAINTQQLAGNQINCIMLMGRTATGGLNNIAKGIFDDLVVRDSQADWLPECRIQPRAPDGDGATLDLVPSTGTSHYAVVDEQPVNTVDYLQGTAVGDLDLLTVEDISVVPASIIGVNMVGFANKTDAASRAWNLGLESGGTADNGPDLSLSTDVQYYSHLRETDPDTGLEWDQTGVNAMQIQPRVAV